MNVHILIKVRKPELEKSATLTLDTIRIGFPTANIHVWLNDCIIEIPDFCKSHFCVTTHTKWIEQLLNTEQEPFWICDSDIVFKESIEDIETDKCMIGRGQPTFYESWLGVINKDRIHTCLIKFYPDRIRREIDNWFNRWPKEVLQLSSLIAQEIIPDKPKPILYDVCCKLYHAVGGQLFTIEQNNRFEHLVAGSYIDLVKGHEHLKERHRQLLLDGIGQEHEEFYKRNKVCLEQI